MEIYVQHAVRQTGEQTLHDEELIKLGAYARNHRAEYEQKGTRDENDVRAICVEDSSEKGSLHELSRGRAHG